MPWEETKLILNDEVRKILDERHVLEEEVKQVIFHAEDTGEKLYRPHANIFLAKLKIGKATFYAEYSAEADGYAVRTAYVHKAEIEGE